MNSVGTFSLSYNSSYASSTSSMGKNTRAVKHLIDKQNVESVLYFFLSPKSTIFLNIDWLRWERHPVIDTFGKAETNGLCSPTSKSTNKFSGLAELCSTLICSKNLSYVFVDLLGNRANTLGKFTLSILTCMMNNWYQISETILKVPSQAHCHC